MGLIERFLRQVELEDPAGFAALRGKPVLYLANHQVAVESIVFNVVVQRARRGADPNYRQNGAPQNVDRTAARCCQPLSQRAWRHPDPNLYFDRSDPASASLRCLENNSGQRWTDGGPVALMVHADGTRALSCRGRTSQVSAVLLDLAIEQNLPVLPVRFVGGLPAEPVPCSPRVSVSIRDSR